MTVIVTETIEQHERWAIRCAPQCLTDIRVQVFNIDGDSGENPSATLTFGLGELLREEIEGYGTLNGTVVLTPSERMNLERWASQMESYVSIIRAALKCEDPHRNGQA